jgi:hypothetical protein
VARVSSTPSLLHGLWQRGRRRWYAQGVALNAGSAGQQGDAEGMLQRALRDIFLHITEQQASGQATHHLTIQYCEIYNKHIM